VRDLHIIRHINAIEKKAEGMGLGFHKSTCRFEVQSLLDEVGKPSIHPMSTVSDGELESGKAFWLFLSKGGSCIACISAKMIDLNDGDFASYFQTLAQERYHNRIDPVENVSQPVIDSLEGRLVYFGGIEFSSSHRGNIRVLGNFAQYARLVAALQWEFDWMYTIIARRHRRLADDYGFETSLRNAVKWSSPAPEGLANDQMFLATSSTHFYHVLSSVEPGQL